MSGYRHIIYVIVSILLLNASNLFAKVYWLPDYLGDNTNRSNGLEDNPQNGVVDKERGCPNGWLDAAQKGDMTCDLMGSYPWVGYCYSNCKCNPDKYLYTEENCSGTKAPTGSSCDDGSGTIYYNQCIDACDTVEGVTNCPYGCKTTFEAEGCPTECKECYTDNCHNRTSVEPCDYGCESYFSDCSSKCQKCYADNCRNRTDNATDLGCDSYWQDCASKCEVGKTCVPTDCSAYTLTSCPANATCTNCTIGCGDSSVKYKVTKCNSGYEWNNTYCIACDFASGGYTLTSCPANGNCTYMTCGGVTKYKLDSCKNDYYLSGGNCVVCNWGDYTLDSCPAKASCYSKTCGGTTKYKFYSCKTRYELRDSSCVCTSNYKVAPNGKDCYEDTTGELSLTYNLPANIKMEFSITAYYGQIDWGDGTVEEITGDASKISHTYSTAGDYKITMTGDIVSVNRINQDYTSYVKEFHNLNLSSVTSLSGSRVAATFGSCSKAEGGFPQLPPKLSSASYLFKGCSKLSGNVPELPSSLKYAEQMFENCKAMDGTISSLPENLSTVTNMFHGCTNLKGPIPALPTKITIAYGMFDGCSSLDGEIPELPSKLKEADQMFNGCSSLEGNIPELPSGLIEVSNMFARCSKLTGPIPALPTGITDAFGMFMNCSNLDGEIPELPSGLKKAAYMFQNCRKLTGEIPELPSGLQHGYYMFFGCSGLTGTINSLPNSLTNTMYMFTGCLNLEGSPTRPSSMQTLNGDCTNDAYTFDCTKITNDGTWNGVGSCAFIPSTDCSQFE